MERTRSRVLREKSDLYATRRIVIEMLRHMDDSIIDKIRNSTKNVTLTPKGEELVEGELRLAFDSILEDAAND